MLLYIFINYIYLRALNDEKIVSQFLEIDQKFVSNLCYILKTPSKQIIKERAIIRIHVWDIIDSFEYGPGAYSDESREGINKTIRRV